MTKHLQNLERLCVKMKERYGEGDSLVLQFEAEVSALKKKRAKDVASKYLGRRSVDKLASAQLMQ